MPRGLPRGTDCRGDPAKYVPLIAERGFMPRPRRGVDLTVFAFGGSRLRKSSDDVGQEQRTGENEQKNQSQIE